MIGKKGPYTVLESKSVYKNPWIAVREDSVVHPNGKKGLFGVVEYQPGISVVAMNKQQEVYLIKKYLYALEEYGVELPSGGIDPTESPLEAAKRELLEETGLVSNTWIPLGYVHPFTMIIKSPAYLFLARDVEQQQKPTDTQEGVDIQKLPFTQACTMVYENEISHAQSAVGILKAKVYIDSHEEL